MEYNLTNFDVATEQPRLEQTADLPIDADFTLPDYLEDIQTILKCCMTPYITGKQISGNVLIVEGIAVVSVLYTGKEGNVCAAEQEVPFKKNFEAAQLLDGGNSEVFATATPQSCRAVTERKLSMKGAVKLDATVFLIEKTTIVADVDSDCFEQLRGEAPATTPMGIAEKSLILDEELALPQGMPAINRIIRNSADSVITDCKIISNKVVVKGELTLYVLYCGADNTLQKYTTVIPFNQIIDIVGIGEECECEAKSSICTMNLTTRTAADGECRSLVLVSKVMISACARCNNNIPVLFDAYCTRHQAQLNKNDVTFTHIVKQTRDSFLCKKKLSLPEGSVDSVMDLWCSLHTSGARADGEGVSVNGSVVVSALICNSENTPGFMERVIDFEYPIAIDAELYKPKCRPDIQILGSSFTLLGNDEIEVAIELIIHATVYDSVTIPLITSLTMDETPLPMDDIALVAYYADKGENVWDISKNFLANRAELLEMNDLTEETLPISKMLLIPKM